MPVTSDNPAPYAPASSVLSIIERHRNRGLPTPVDTDVLARAGVTQSLIPRTLQALQTLDLIDENGRPTDMLEGLRLAPESEYKQRLAEWLNAAYADALQFIDPATADETEIRDAFRSYRPTGQQSRMVSLFVALFAAAGIGPERQTPTPRRSARAAASPRTNRTPRALAGPTARSRPNSIGELPPALAGLLASLPPQGQGWTEEERGRFMATIGPVIDYCYPVIGSGQENEELEVEEKSGHGADNSVAR
jgi:hypothetical protein